MKSIYLIRHTTPAVSKGICYGQTDLDVTESFMDEAAIIRQHLPPSFSSVHTSPLQRCSRLAEHLFPGHSIRLHPELMEIHCGQWEMRGWDDLPKEEVDPWMKDFVQIRIPGGESYLDLHQRVTGCFGRIHAGIDGQSLPTPGMAGSSDEAIAIVAHGGVIRSILSHITGTALIDSFKVFSLHYGCVIRVYGPPDSLQYEILSNQPPLEKEQHKPRSFY
ncbi:MAG TPA: alpha-ribazole phosphatase family protein [Puia sp.]|nr:alpha-ribazole phosphatase family protein [Puia sp.]